jgi:hypothetical protein
MALLKQFYAQKVTLPTWVPMGGRNLPPLDFWKRIKTFGRNSTSKAILH